MSHDYNELEVGGGVNEAIKTLISQGEQNVRVLDLFDDGAAVNKMVLFGKGEHEFVTYNKPAPSRNHRFASLNGFVDFLNSEESGGKGIVFVGDKDVTANLAYQQPGPYQLARLPLDDSEEFAALKVLQKGIGQKGLWRLLVSTLRGCVSPTLLMAISQIKVSGSTEAESNVDVMGIGNNASRDSLAVTFCPKSGGPSKTEEVPVDWVWSGRIWEPFDQQFSINLRLEIEAGKDGLTFRFHPERLGKVLREARIALTEHIANYMTSEFSVYDGEI